MCTVLLFCLTGSINSLETGQVPLYRRSSEGVRGCCPGAHAHLHGLVTRGRMLSFYSSTSHFVPVFFHSRHLGKSDDGFGCSRGQRTCGGRVIGVNCCWAAAPRSAVENGYNSLGRDRKEEEVNQLHPQNSAMLGSESESDEPRTSSPAVEEGEIMTALSRLLKQRRALESLRPAPVRRWEASTGLLSPQLLQKTKKKNQDDVLFSVDARDLINISKKTDKEEEYLRKYLKVRRDNVVEVLKTSMLEAKFSPTYTNEVVPTLPSFIDYVLVEAVGLKKDPRYKALDFKQRAKVYIGETGVVPLIRRLKHNGVTVPRIGHLVCEAGDRLDMIVPRLEWLKSVHVKGRDLGVVLTRVPRLLKEPIRNLEETTYFLQRSGVKMEWIGTLISRTPGVLAITSQELHERVQYFRELGMSPEQYGAMVFNFPAVLGKFSLDEIRPKVDCLTGILSDHAGVVRVISEKPQLLACSVEEGWTPLIKYFYVLGIDIFGIRRILACNPATFCLNIQDNIAPKVRFLKAIGVHDEAVGQTLVRFPAIFSYSVDKKMRPLVRFLLEIVGVPEEDVGKVVANRPDLFGNSIPHKLELIVRFFKAIGLKRKLLGPMVAEFPVLLKYNYPILHPKYRYLKRVMLRPMAEVVAFPRYFSYSLPGRIIPRHKILSEKGLKFTLKYMLACTDSVFNERVEAAEKGRIPDDAVVPDTPEYCTEEFNEDIDEEWEEEYIVAPVDEQSPCHPLWETSEAFLKQLQVETSRINELKSNLQ